ncbi:uncharacterized protein ARMOST_19422 [Armillaria ostoyae]|uniref:Uncharacterized protein n=1 Tax=Armillaria ostoyae TaxID=47428 RepID=A0A284S4H2_ARMOS|nr:uncharacterized protein ARMOST_19419 [Armillaria ostoyae]SJL15914.1 uncharacterized protein ARMOST_19422 [Armillaria ostoyae]
MSKDQADVLCLQTTPSTYAPYVLSQVIEHQHALETEGKRTLEKCGLQETYPNLVHDILYGALIGFPPPLTQNFIPQNSSSAMENEAVVDQYLQEEIAAGHMYGGLSIEDGEIFFGGHFRTAPLAVIDEGSKFHVIHNLSAKDGNGDSTNSWLNAKDNPTKWYTASMFADAVVKAPPGTQVAGLDWIKAYQCSPIIPSHKCYIATYWHGLIWPNHCIPFGLTTAENIQGEVADAFKDILVWHKIPNVFKWVDDFDILRYPTRSITNDDGLTKFHYAFDLSTIFGISDPLGILWHPVVEKGHDFASKMTYVGF